METQTLTQRLREELLARRKKHSITQDRVAIEAGVSQGAVSRFCMGYDVTAGTIDKIAAWLGAKVAFGGKK